MMVLRWAEYFEQVLNVEDVRSANINAVRDRRLPVLIEVNESAKEIREAVNELKSG